MTGSPRFPGPAGRAGSAGVLDEEGRRLLDEQQGQLFPATVRPGFTRLLWAGLAVLAVGAGVVIAVIGGMLP